MAETAERLVMGMVAGLDGAGLGMMGIHMCCYLYSARFGGPGFRWIKTGPFSSRVDGSLAWLSTHGRIEVKDGAVVPLGKASVPNAMEEGVGAVAELVKKRDTGQIIRLASAMYWLRQIQDEGGSYGPVEVAARLREAGLESDHGFADDMKAVEGAIADLETGGFTDRPGVH